MMITVMWYQESELLQLSQKQHFSGGMLPPLMQKSGTPTYRKWSLGICIKIHINSPSFEKERGVIFENRKGINERMTNIVIVSH
jgi:hypothetical protein